MFMKRNRCRPASESSIFRVTLAPDTIAKLQLDVVPGQGTASSGTICETAPASQTAAVQVRVTDLNGIPMGGVWVGLYLRSGLYRSLLLSSGRTGPEGSWCVSSLDVGAYILKAQWVEREDGSGKMTALEDAAEIQVGESAGLFQVKLQIPKAVPKQPE